MALTDVQIEAALERVYALIGDADAAWDHHPELTLGELVNVIVKGLPRKDLEVLAGHPAPSGGLDSLRQPSGRCKEKE